MHDQGNADVITVSSPDEVPGQIRPGYVSAARSAINTVRSGDPDAVDMAKQDGPDSPYSVNEVSTALGVSKSTIYKAVESGALTGMRFGNTRKGTIRIPHDAFVEYVADCMAAAVTRPGANAKHRTIRVQVTDEASAGKVA